MNTPNTLKEQADRHYVIWGPDDLPISPAPALGTQGVVDEIARFVGRFEPQGYYRDSQMRRLSFSEVLETLMVEEHELAMTPTMAYTAYIQGLVGDIRDGKCRGVMTYAEFLDSEACEDAVDADSEEVEAPPTRPISLDGFWCTHDVADRQ